MIIEELAAELENSTPEYQKCIAVLLRYADGMGAYGDPHNEPQTTSTKDR